MNYSEHNTPNTLPQFSELTTRTNVTTVSYASNESDELQNSQNIIYTTAADSTNCKQVINSPNKYSNTILNWPETNILMQFCEKQSLQAINIPAYNQNNASVNVSSHNTSMRIIQNSDIPQTDENTDNKNDASHIKFEIEDINFGTLNSQSLQPQSISMTEYIQKLQSTTLPLTLHQLIKMQAEQSKKDKDSEQRNDQAQNNILNIPNVPIIYKTSQMQSDSQYVNNDHSMILNPSDVNVHMEEQPENHNNTQNPIQPQKIEQSVQPDTVKPEKRIKFRAKTGEIKITVALDGSHLYCCPECNLAFPHMTEIDRHLQVHVQERKYQCKECGAMLKRKEHLDQHMRGHSDERPFKCPMCQKAFKRNEHLTRHFVIHSGDKNFTCQVCQKAFSRKDHLNKHTQTHLGIKKVKPKKEIVELPSCNDSTATSMLLRSDINNLLKESSLKQDTTQFLQHIQNLQRDSSLMQTFSAFKEHVLKDGSVLQQQAVNMNEILPQNTRYLMPS
ncbi:zinc finger protein 121-like isoform X1 [Phymastichus coffea]|uniref:zinc finger protein 121-like isoform X1 n=1 Tax=Phymastichus coffea TaxID=108790 RepID=UPI00273A7EE4|nr:zinc finger protein 121-like isoform X1 [Phymastichus coffea]XP_058803877.1 zinc finger protein 121-like isoform X1 [Phymastichus coffea]XP_058803878.1 zinc finger protein 121-like isoform X1 [Phymastichus coffea]XP_058803879.1 zinc finger protein 121-like isoform X1 [Phymastichus coffea]XP_058803880.1 zinc finger protein 121-like isoform X1 [Phymastichus coffea]XP_058803881.1 zinc finger protein 121-like isoform X1 [Phymastichus coffea]